ncbi:MAG: hypothetical protein JRN52_06700 [Nitrososphaerota archaeon]|nr:hypothetical protein [Nitrososphaerota archaeon]
MIKGLHLFLGRIRGNRFLKKISPQYFSVNIDEVTDYGSTFRVFVSSKEILRLSKVVNRELCLLRLEAGLPVKTRATTTATITTTVRPTIKITLWSIGNAIRFFGFKANSEILGLIFDLAIARRIRRFHS